MKVSVLRRWRRSGNLFAYLSVQGINASGVLDYGRNRYLGVNGSTTDSSEIVTYGTPGLATMVDSDGFQKWNPHNLALNSATPATQSITVVSGNDYTVEITGTGSVTLSGAGTGTVTAGSPVEVTASTTTLTLTVSGSPSTLSTYRSDQGGMAPVPTGQRIAGSLTYVPTTSAAVYFPRENSYLYDAATSSWVNNGLFLESEARTNLNDSSSNFSGWAETGVTETNGDTITAIAGSSAHRISKNIGSPGGGAAVSWAVLERVNYDFVILYDGADTRNFAVFNLSTGQVVNEGTNTKGLIKSLGDGKFMCAACYGDVSPPNGNTFIGLAPSATGTWGQNFTAVGTESFKILHHQLEAGSTPSSYIPTAGSTVTRLGQTAVIEPANNPLIEVGSELVGPSDWTGNLGGPLPASITVNDGVVTLDSAEFAATAENVIGYVSGDPVVVTVDIEITSGQIEIWLATTGGFEGQVIIATTSGAYSFYGSAVGASGAVYVRSLSAGTSGTVSNISVKPLSMPAALSIGLKGKVTYADEGVVEEVVFVNWRAGVVDYIRDSISTLTTRTGESNFVQRDTGSGLDVVTSSTGYYSPGINVPFNIASRHGATFINGAVDGTALTANTTPTALPDLVTSDFRIGPDFMGHIQELPLYAANVADAGLEEITS